MLGGLGGVCSECVDDDDCEYGCTSFGFSGAPDYARCNAGELSAGCLSSAACQPEYTCEVVLEIDGLLDYGYGGCSDCSSDDDCAPNETCQPQMFVPMMTAFNTCVEDDSLGPDATCLLGPSGDRACPEGTFCLETSGMGLFTAGMCSECSNSPTPNEGCAGGQTCVEPVLAVGSGMNEPGYCQ